PRFQNTEKYIDMRLQEMERENFVRLKMIRSTIEKNEKAAAAAEAAQNAEA
ncbi:V-type ATP synthase subunit D, partial [Methanobrevibacter sp.]